MHQAGISKHREDLSQQLLCEATHEMNQPSTKEQSCTVEEWVTCNN